MSRRRLSVSAWIGGDRPVKEARVGVDEGPRAKAGVIFGAAQARAREARAREAAGTSAGEDGDA